MAQIETIEKTSSRQRLYALFMLLVIASVVIWWKVGNPVKAIMSWWLPTRIDAPIVKRTEALSPFEQAISWELFKSYGVLPVQVFEKGRSNPFLMASPPATPKYRDEQRLSDLRLFTNILSKYFISLQHYPVAADIVLGKANAACLNKNGWTTISVCTQSGKEPGKEKEGAEIYLLRVPADPGTNEYRYTSNGAKFEISFTLEEPWGDFAPGRHTLTPTGIR